MSEKLTMLEKARVKAHDYADEWETVYDDMQQDGELVTLHAKLKTAYQQGYLDGFKLRLTGDE